jgi:hypothetical protein
MRPSGVYLSTASGKFLESLEGSLRATGRFAGTGFAAHRRRSLVPVALQLSRHHQLAVELRKVERVLGKQVAQ